MSTSNNRINLASAVPNEAIEVAESKPDVRQAYNTETVTSGDIGSQINSAASNNAILELPAGEYSMSSGVSPGGGVAGVVGAGSGQTTVNCGSGSFLFNTTTDDFVMEGITFQASGDRALGKFQVGNQGWFEDIVFRGQRNKYGANGRRMTFLVEADPGATNYIHQCQFPDGGTWREGVPSVGSFAIGPNADPGHEGLNVWHECYAEGFMDNGFYVNNSPGRNVLWNCTAVNNRVSGMRLGNNDVVVGGLASTTDLPDGAHGSPLVANSGSNIHVVGLKIVARGDSVSSGARGIQIRSDIESISFDRVVAHADGALLARLDEADIDITDSWWLQENNGSHAVRIGDAGSPANVTADSTLRLLNTDAEEISGPITIDGQSYSGVTTASEAGLEDPRPFPEFHFDGVESGQGSEYGGSFDGGAGGGEMGVASWATTGPRFIDGSGSPGSRWGLNQNHVATVDGPQGVVETTVEPQWFNNGATTAAVAAGGGGGTGGTGGGDGVNVAGSAEGIGVTDGPVDLEYDFTQTVDASEGPAAIQTALDSVSAGEGVRVEGEGTHEWGETVEVPDEVGLDLSTDATFTIPDGHSLSTYQSANVLSAVTNANRNGAADVTIQGGNFDFSSVTDTTSYAGVWLHNAENSQVRDTVVTGAGIPVAGSSDHRAFGVCMTACENAGIYDSEGHDSGYDDIGIRGANVNCEVVGCSGSGGDSGTIQAAPWGGWSIGNGGGDGILIQDCSGERIYAHDTSNVLFNECSSSGRIQTIGVQETATVSGSTGFEGTVLLYTLDSSQPETTVSEMEFAAGSANAIEIGTNGGESLGEVTISDCTSERDTFMNFNAYDNSGGIDTIAVEGCTLSGTTLVSQEDGADEADTLRFTECEISGFSTGITGTYGTVVVEDCTVTGMTEDDLLAADAQIQASGNTYE